jgi:hypothetical protein
MNHSGFVPLLREFAAKRLSGGVEPELRDGKALTGLFPLGNFGS